MAIAQKLAGYTLGQADLLRRAMGKKKKEVLDAEYGPLLRRHERQRLLRSARSRRCGTSWSRSPTTRSTRPTRRRTAWSPTGPPTSRPTTRPSTWPRCSPRCRDDKDKSAIYLNECRRMKIQVLPPDVNESAANFTPVGNDIRFGLTAIRNVGHNVVDGIVAARAEKGRYTDFNDFLDKVARAGLQQARGRVADQGRRVRRHEAPAPGAGGDPRGGRRPVRRHQAQRGDRPGLAVRRPRRRPSGFGVTVDDPRHRGVGQDDRCSATSATCSASTSPTTRCSASSTCSPRAPTAPSAS